MMTALSFFFFQAEDGIRDLTVTGVQTCALPIYPELGIGEHTRRITTRKQTINRARSFAKILYDDSDGHHSYDVFKDSVTIRSEERRVGKKCRSRWSRYH